MCPMDEEFTAWFTREILAHEPALMRFLKRSWLTSSDVADLCHDVYIKVLEVAEAQRPASPKAFLFATAKNLLIDRTRRKRVIPIDLLQDMDSLNVLVDDLSPERAAGGLQHLLRLTKAFERLPDRCRDVVWLRKIEDLPQKEIAQRLNIAEATVEAHLVRGMRMLIQLYCEEDGTDAAEAGKKRAEHENKHGK
jgi:RNA polymerase sigma factor (sigma-70 family)